MTDKRNRAKKFGFRRPKLAYGRQLLACLMLCFAWAVMVLAQAVPFFSFEAEQGSLNGDVSAIADGNASAGNAIMFNSPPATGSFAYPVSTANRKFIDQNGNPYLLKTMSSWAMSQEASNTEITQALEGLKSLGFNAATVSPFGVHMNDSFGDRYKNKAGQSFFTGTPFASSLGPAWSSMDWVMQEATRLHMTIVFSQFLSWGDTGTTPDVINAGTTNNYNYGKAVAQRYASYPNIVWHVMGDFEWHSVDPIGRNLDAMFHGLKDGDGSNQRLIIAEQQNGLTGYDQFISDETGTNAYQWFKQSANELYNYGSAAVEQFDNVWNEAGATSYPLVDIEPPYVNAPHYPGNQNQQLRERNYATFIRGGSGINYGHEKWWPFGVTGLFDGGPGWLNILSQAPQLHAKHAWTVLDEYVADASWTPDNGTFLKTGLGSGDTKAASGMSSDAALVYFPSTRSVTVDTSALSGNGNVRLRWYDPTSGAYTTIAASESQTASRSIAYPSAHGDGTNDWLLVVDLN